MNTQARLKILDLSDLNDDETYTAYGVIGGGIRSHFLYSLYPHAFPNRSQNAVWSLYFLSGKQDFGLADASEFVMIDIKSENMKTQQNYFYPYDLFAFYALKNLANAQGSLVQPNAFILIRRIATSTWMRFSIMWLRCTRPK